MRMPVATQKPRMMCDEPGCNEDLQFYSVFFRPEKGRIPEPRPNFCTREHHDSWMSRNAPQKKGPNSFDVV